MHAQPVSLIRYGTAALSVAVALVVTLLMWPLVRPMASPLFLAAIVISAWRGGKWPGTVATILSGLTIDFIFIPPQYQLSGGWDDISRLIVFGFEGFTLSWLVDSRKRVIGEVRSSREKLRALSTHLQSAIEDERGRMAREIHDELGQELTGLKFDVFWVRDQLSEPAYDLNRSLLVDKLNRTLERVDSTIHSVRRIATELRPAVLDTLGLAAAVEWQAADFERRTGIKCSLSTNLEDQTLDRGTSTAVFRVFQETLTNVARHARASRVDVDLRREDDHLLLRTRDNGKGIEDIELSGSSSLGIAGMQERVKLLDGKIRILGQEEKGTVVEVSIPLRDGAIHSLQD